jgi:hypothetical protein
MINQFAESSGLISLTLNRGTVAFDRDVLGVSVPSQGWYTGLCGNGYCPSWLDSFGESQIRVLVPTASVVWWAIWYKQYLLSSLAMSLICEQLLVPSAHCASCSWALWSLTFQPTTRISKLVKYVSYFTRQQMCCSIPTLAMAGQPLPQQGQVTKRWALSTIPGIKLSILPNPALWGHLHILPLPCQAEVNYVLCLWCSACAGGCNLSTSCAGLCGSLKSR